MFKIPIETDIQLTACWLACRQVKTEAYAVYISLLFPPTATSAKSSGEMTSLASWR